MYDEERNLSDETEKDIDSAKNTVSNFHDMYDRFFGDDDSTSSGDASNDDPTDEKNSGTQAEAGASKDLTSDTSEGKTPDNSSPIEINNGSEAGEQVGSGLASEIGEEAVKEGTEAAIETSEAVKAGAEAGSAAASAAEGAATASAASAGAAGGAAAGAAGGPVGIIIGGVLGALGDKIGYVILAIIGIWLFGTTMLGVALASWNPTIFDDATLAWNNRRSAEAVEATKDNYLNAAASNEDLLNSFNLLRPFLKSLKKSSSGSLTEDRWDCAYLISAYSVYKKMYSEPVGTENTDSTKLDDPYEIFYTTYDTSTTSYAEDLKTLFGGLISYAIEGEEVTYEIIESTPVSVPVYKAVSLTVNNGNGKETKTYYTYVGEEEKTKETKDYEYTPVTVTLAKSGEVVSDKYYVRSSEKTKIYSPGYTVTYKTETVHSILSKSAVLHALNLDPTGIYQGDPAMAITNAEYVDYLRTVMIETLGIDETEYTSGGFLWPCDPEKYGPCVYELTDYFGYRSAESTNGIGSTNHKGIDIAWGGCYGAEVRAAKAGTVTVASYYGGYGNCVMIDHGDGTMTVYGHLSSILVAQNTTVTQGQTIGLIGSTGNSTGPHLHYEIRVDGEPVDPLTYYQESVDENGNTVYLPINSYDAKDPSEYRDMVIQGMNELGIAVTEEKVQRFIKQIETESGGDPMAVQHGYEDCNTYAKIEGWTCPWCPGRDGVTCENYNRAHGLMQMIPSTFLAYKIEGHDNIFDPYDSILAALNYIEHRYNGDYSYIGNGEGY